MRRWLVRSRARTESPERRSDARQALSLGSSFVPHLGQKSHSSITQPSGGCVCQARAAMAAVTEVAGTRRRFNLALVCSIGVERGQDPHHLLGLALWTSRPASDVLTHPLRLRELLAACFAVILVGWHTFLLRVKSGDSHATISSVDHTVSSSGGRPTGRRCLMRFAGITTSNRPHEPVPEPVPLVWL